MTLINVGQGMQGCIVKPIIQVLSQLM